MKQTCYLLTFLEINLFISPTKIFAALCKMYSFFEVTYNGFFGRFSLRPPRHPYNFAIFMKLDPTSAAGLHFETSLIFRNYVSVFKFFDNLISGNCEYCDIILFKHLDLDLVIFKFFNLPLQSTGS